MNRTGFKRQALHFSRWLRPVPMRYAAVVMVGGTIFFCGLLSGLSSGSPAIEVWHGDIQRVGHLGDAQDDFNLMGRVRHWREVDTLSWRLGSGAAIPLAFRAFRRLVSDGDFNADIPIAGLRAGRNQVTITANFKDGRTISKTVTVVKESGSQPLPARIRWKDVRNPQDVGQYVDGLWSLEQTGLRTRQIGYDRVFLIGERNWRDYDVRTSITLHAVASETTPVSGGAGVGLILRFAGHITGGPRHFASGQPKWGYQPFGALSFLRWKKGEAQHLPQKQFYPGDSNQAKSFGEFPARLGETYSVRFRCETLPDAAEGRGVTRYSFKIWKATDAEPDAWGWQEAQTSAIALRQGGVALVAHHVDATFGDIEIQPR